MEKRKKYYPVLMYHEVSSTCSHQVEENFMTPIYNISSSCFEKQLRTIHELNIDTGLVHELGAEIPGKNKTVFLTFDDGCIGNHTEALPLLRQYGQRATFFVTTNLIGTDNYMTWEQVKDLANEGMAVQSHAMNHVHLTTLSGKRLLNELTGSKKIIEDKILQPVTALSLPHGSYNQQTIDCAVEAGYSVVCTSDVHYNSSSSWRAHDAAVCLGRIAITTKTPINTFISLVQGKKRAILKERLKKGSKNLLKRIIGIENYGKLYRLYFNIKDD